MKHVNYRVLHMAFVIFLPILFMHGCIVPPGKGAPRFPRLSGGNVVYVDEDTPVCVSADDLKDKEKNKCRLWYYGTRTADLLNHEEPAIQSLNMPGAELSVRIVEKDDEVYLVYLGKVTPEGLEVKKTNLLFSKPVAIVPVRVQSVLLCYPSEVVLVEYKGGDTESAGTYADLEVDDELAEVLEKANGALCLNPESTEMSEIVFFGDGFVEKAVLKDRTLKVFKPDLDPGSSTFGRDADNEKYNWLAAAVFLPSPKESGGFALFGQHGTTRSFYYRRWPVGQDKWEQDQIGKDVSVVLLTNKIVDSSVTRLVPAGGIVEENAECKTVRGGCAFSFKAGDSRVTCRADRLHRFPLNPVPFELLRRKRFKGRKVALECRRGVLVCESEQGIEAVCFFAKGKGCPSDEKWDCVGMRYVDASGSAKGWWGVNKRADNKAKNFIWGMFRRIPLFGRLFDPGMGVVTGMEDWCLEQSSQSPTGLGWFRPAGLDRWMVEVDCARGNALSHTP